MENKKKKEAGDSEEKGEGGESGGSWATTVRDSDGVMTCLKRALKVANAAQQQSAIRGVASTEPVALFVEILNHYLYFFDQGLATITPSIIQVSGVVGGAVRAWVMNAPPLGMQRA